MKTTPHRLRALSGSGSNSKDRQPANGDGEDEAEVETPSKKPNSAERRVTFVDPQRQAQATRGHAQEKPKQNGKVPAPKVKFEASPRPGYSAPEAPQGIKIPAKRGRKASTTAQSLVVTLPDISCTADKTDKPKSKRPRANSNASSTADETQDGSDSGGSYLPPPKRRRADSNSSVTRNALETFSLGDHTDDSQDNQPAAANTLKPSLKGPLSAYETDRTFLRVTADNQLDRGPVRVSFPTFNGKTKTEKLFQLLLSERGIHEDLQKRVSALTATFTWSQERVGIRKGRDGDWDYVREVVGKAWRNERRLFEGKGCNIDVMIHVD